jgi:hypothetical protein
MLLTATIRSDGAPVDKGNRLLLYQRSANFIEGTPEFMGAIPIEANLEFIIFKFRI